MAGGGGRREGPSRPCRRTGCCVRALVVDDEAPAREELAWLLGPRPARRQPSAWPAARPRRCARSDARARRRRVLRHQDARPRRPRPRPRAGALRAAAARRLRDRLRRARDRTPSTCGPPTTCSSRCGPSGWPRRCAGWSQARASPSSRRTRRPSRTTRRSPSSSGASSGSCSASEVRYVEAHGDYARLHTAESSHLVRVPLTTLEERWANAGFVRIHRSTLVALAARRRDPHRRRPLQRPARATRCCR